MFMCFFFIISYSYPEFSYLSDQFLDAPCIFQGFLPEGVYELDDLSADRCNQFEIIFGIFEMLCENADLVDLFFKGI